MKEIKVFLKRHTAVFLMLAVVLTMSVGTLWAKYTTDVTVTGELSLEVKAEQKYVINWDTFRRGLYAIVKDGIVPPPTALKFVTGDVATRYYGWSYPLCEDETHHLIISFDSNTKTMYIGPWDSNDSTSVVYAPENSSYLLYGGNYPSGECLFFKNLTTLDCSNLSTSKVTNMNNMFSQLTKLTDLTLGSRFDTSNVTNMSSMFSGDTALTSLDLSCFDTSRVTNMSNMFMNCSNLSTITVASGFNIESVISGYDANMFAGCTSLVGGEGTEFDSTKVDKTYAKIDGGASDPGYFTDVSDGLMSLSMNLASDIFAVAADPVQDGDTVDPVGDVTDVTEVTTEEPVVTEESGVAETPAPSEEDSFSDTSKPTEELLPVTGQNEETDALDNSNS